MRKLFAILFLILAASGARAIDQIIATISVTNAVGTTNGNTIVINGSTRTWTNTVTSSPSTLIAVTNSPALVTTNLLTHLGSYSPGSSLSVTYGSSTSVVVRGSAGAALTVTAAGGWAVVSLSTNTYTQAYLVRVPITIETATNQTNIASFLVKATDSSTNSFPTNSVALSNYVSASPVAQSFGNKTITNGVINGARGTNIIGLNGTVWRLTNGNYSAPILESPISTNAINYGNAFSSPGTNSGAEQFGLGALTKAASATALGNSSQAAGQYSLALGYSTIAGLIQDMALGPIADAEGGNSTAIGYAAVSVGSNSIAIGNSASSPWFNSIAIGYAAASTTSNQFRLGSASHTISIPGVVSGATLSNTISAGTNLWTGDLSFPAYANSSLANGNNAAILIGTNFFMTASGPTAAYSLNGFQGGRNGKEFIFEKDDSFTCTIANDSGVDPTAANRIYTGTGGDLTLTNNPGFIRFIYNSARSRWCVISKSN